MRVLLFVLAAAAAVLVATQPVETIHVAGQVHGGAQSAVPRAAAVTLLIMIALRALIGDE